METFLFLFFFRAPRLDCGQICGNNFLLDKQNETKRLSLFSDLIKRPICYLISFFFSKSSWIYAFAFCGLFPWCPSLKYNGWIQMELVREREFVTKKSSSSVFLYETKIYFLALFFMCRIKSHRQKFPPISDLIEYRVRWNSKWKYKLR